MGKYIPFYPFLRPTYLQESYRYIKLGFKIWPKCPKMVPNCLSVRKGINMPRRHFFICTQEKQKKTKITNKTIDVIQILNIYVNYSYLPIDIVEYLHKIFKTFIAKSRKLQSVFTIILGTT